MNNSIIEFGGTVNLIVRAISDFSMGTHSFKKGDILLTEKDVDMTLVFSEGSATASKSVSRYMSYHNEKPSRLTFSACTLTERFLDLFYIKNNNENLVTIIDTLEGGYTIFLREEWAEDTAVTLDNRIVSDFVYDKENNSITFNEKPEGKIEVTYMTKTKGINFSLREQQHIPYLGLEVVGVGNREKENCKTVLKVEKASLSTTPYINSQKTSFFDMEFVIIDGDVTLGVY